MNWPVRSTLATLQNLRAGTTVAVCALVTGLREMMTRRGRDAGKKMARLALEDQFGRCEAVVFASDYTRMQPVLRKDSAVYVTGEMESGSETSAGLIIREAVPIEAAAERACAGLVLRMRRGELGEGGKLGPLRDALGHHAGDRPVLLRIEPDDAGAEGFDMELGPAWRVVPDRACIDDLRGCLGANRVGLLPRKPAARERSRFARASPSRGVPA